MLILPDLPLSGSDCGWASIGVLREIRSDADSLAWWARLSRDDDRWSRVPLAPIFSISFWPRLLRVRLRRENVFSRFPFFLSSLLSSLSDSMDVLLLLPLRDDAEDATLQPAEKEEFPPTSSARSWATLVWRTTSMAWGSKEEFSLPQTKLWEKFSYWAWQICWITKLWYRTIWKPSNYHRKKAMKMAFGLPLDESAAYLVHRSRTFLNLLGSLEIFQNWSKKH